MGSCLSQSKYKHVYTDNAVLRPLKPQFDAFMLEPEEIGMLYEIFQSVDKDKSGYVSTQELFEHLAVQSTYFRDRVFSIFDEDGSGKIDFSEFVLSLWNYCTLSKASLGTSSFS